MLAIEKCSTTIRICCVAKLRSANDTVRADTIYLFVYFTYCTEHYRYYGFVSL